MWRVCSFFLLWITTDFASNNHEELETTTVQNALAALQSTKWLNLTCEFMLPMTFSLCVYDMWLKQTAALEKENSRLWFKNCLKTECVLLSTALVSTWQSILIVPNLFHKSINRQRDVQGRLWVSVWTPWILPNVNWCLHEKFAITYTFHLIGEYD